MELRVRLDLPALADPDVRNLLQESELFARSFYGGSGFGLLSPFGVVHIISLCLEVVSQICVLIVLTRQTPQYQVILISLLATLTPLVIPYLPFSQMHTDPLYTPKEARAAERQQKMRALVYNDSYRQEILLFGLGPWILRTWAAARRATHYNEKRIVFSREFIMSLFNMNATDLLSTLQNVGLVMNSLHIDIHSITRFHWCLCFSHRQRHSVQSRCTVARCSRWCWLSGVYRAPCGWRIKAYSSWGPSVLP